MSSPDPSHDSFVSDQWYPYDDVIDEPSQQETQTSELKLCQLLDWDSGKTYDDSYMRYVLNRAYSIEYN